VLKRGEEIGARRIRERRKVVSPFVKLPNPDDRD
jgi:hypothetical protein